jgi:dihydrolipoamide dehydrogenase
MRRRHRRPGRRTARRHARPTRHRRRPRRPQVVFTDPQVGAVGRTESEARAVGFPVLTVEYDTGLVIGAQLQAQKYTGRAKLVVDKQRWIILGATFVGPNVVDLLHSATVAVTAEVTLDKLWHAVPVFPSTGETWLNLLQECGL